MTPELFMPLAQLLVALLLSLVILIYHHRMGPRWLWVMKEILLWSVIARRVDEIGLYYGRDLISVQVGWLLAWLFLLAVTLSAYRLTKIARVLRSYDDRIDKLERMRVRSESKIGNWDHQTPYPKIN
jgi:hypothetical protein